MKNRFIHPVGFALLGLAFIAGIARAQQLPDGMVLNEWAGEKQVANPVAIEVDEQNRVYVAETFRQKKGVDDNRNRGFWLMDDLAAQTVEDRLAYIKKWQEKVPIEHYTTYEDRVTRLADTDGDGKADEHKIFADGFNDILDGTGAGVLAIDGDVYYTCIPNLWLLPDGDGDGKADRKESLSFGYGVRTALRGHDSHGLVRGPDGRIYFSIGDRGYHIKTREGKLLHAPGSGAVFRCDRNGDNLELFATGLRNPQELAFDAHGNLWTGDNNSDAGDKARIVYIAEGGETGWHMSYQTMGGRYSRGPWHMDKLWHTQHEGQAAWVLPPIAHVSNGPSGFAYYPGTGLSEDYAGSFFLVDFKGGPGNSGIYTWKTQAKGAGFELAGVEKFLWNMLITDFCFGYDGKIYLSDWINGWDGLGKGLIHTLHDPKAIESAGAKETKALFAAGFEQLPAERLGALLAHADMRVRLRAQYALADRGAEGDSVLSSAVAQQKTPIARLHGIWGAWQRSLQGDSSLAEKMAAYLSDSDDEVAAQAARLMGEAKVSAATSKLIALLTTHENDRVKYFAAIALGKLQASSGVEPLLGALAKNADQDVFLRHACVMGLTGAAGPDALLSLAGHEHRSARLGVLLALRRHQDPRISIFLNDADAGLVEEAARAINDLPLNEAMPGLAAKLGGVVESETFARRAINANFRVGDSDAIARLVSYASDVQRGDKMRAEALQALGDWAKPSPRDRVLGYYRPLEPRSVEPVRVALATAIPKLMQGGGQAQKEATKLAKTYDIKADSDFMFTLVRSPEYPLSNRQEALAYLVDQKDPAAAKALAAAAASESEALRAFALRQYVAFSPADAMKRMQAAIKAGSVLEQQAALQSMPLFKGAAEKASAAALVAKAVSGLGALRSEVKLDAVEAARVMSADAGVAAALAAYEAGLDQADMVAPYNIGLYGGDVARGKYLFENHIAAQCMRCHKAGDGHAPGGEAGPNLWGIADNKSREYLLEALVNPSATIAEGFDIVTLFRKDGSVASGTLLSESEVDVVLVDFVGKKHYVLKKEIAKREAAKASAMPPMGAMMKPSEIRDVVAFLASLKTQP